MKRIFSILVIACIAMLFSACHKDGVYNPSKKISKIYYTNNSGEKNLSQVWTWNKNLLEKIDFYSGGSQAYTYNFTYDKKRLIRMNNYASNRYIEYKYDGKGLKEANTYSDGQLVDTYSFTHKDGKIVNITDTYFGSKSNDEEMMINPLQFVLPEELYTATANAKKIDKANGDKSTVVYHYELTWKNNNVSKVVRTVDGRSTVVTIEAQYDKKKNPYYGAYTQFWFEDNVDVNFSQNNVTKIDETYNDGSETEFDSWRYEYVYDGQYPTSRRYIEDDYTSLTEFEYTK